jgi:peptide/nickel transport system substrate-binding protein
MTFVQSAVIRRAYKVAPHRSMEGSTVAKDKRYAWRLIAAVGALALVATACGDGAEDPDDDAPETEEAAPDPDDDGDEDVDTEEPGDDADASPGLADCDDNPNDCNSGPRADGGSITWLVNQGHDGVYNHHRPEGGSVYLLQMIEGIEPRMGYFAPDGEWVWDFDYLASEPEIVNEDPQTMVYELNPDAAWSDGTPISADDFEWNWRHNSGDEDLCEGCDPRATAAWEQVASVEGSDDGRTVTITLEDGTVNPEWFAQYGVTYPAHWSGADWQTPEGMGESSIWFNENVPDWSGGPYIVDEWIADERAIFVPNPDWWGETQPTLDSIVKEIITDQGSWLPALQNREIDGGSPASFFVDLVDELESLGDVHVGLGSAGAVWEHVDVNMDTIPDQTLRQAIFTALDTEDMRSRIYGDLEPPLRTNHIFSSLSPYHEDKLTGTGYGTGDIDAARSMLEEAGYEGFDGGTLVDPDGNEVPEIRFAFLSGNENRAQYTELAQSYLADIGLTIIPEAIPGEQLGTVLGEADFDLVIFGWSGSPLFTTAPDQFYNSESGSNFGNLSNPELDELLPQIANQIDIADSAELANQAVEIVMEEAYSLPLWDTLNLSFVSDEYANIRDNHNSSLRSLYNMEEWGVLAVN